LLAAEGLVKSRQFPYTALIYQVAARNLVIFGHNLIGYFLAAIVCGTALSWHMILVVPSLVLVLLNGIWMTIVVAVFCLRFRDFQQLVASFLQIATFITPIFWNASQIKGTRALVVHLNPLHHMVDIVRQPLLGNLPPLESYLVCIGVALVGWAIAFWLFAGKRHRLAYWY
jgi:lipopolysaccharide transport system permease protein